MFYRLHRMLLNAQGGEGNGPTQTPPAAPKVDPSEAYQRKLDTLGDDAEMKKFHRKLYLDNFRYRRELEEARGKIPPEGSRVLAPEEAKKLDAVLKHGTLDEVAKAVEAYPEAAKKLANIERKESLVAVAKKAGVSADKVDLMALLARDAKFEVRAEKVEGKDAEVVYVKDGDAEAVRFDQFGPFAEAMDSLRSGRKADAEAETPPRVQGTPRRTAAPAPRDPNRKAADPLAEAEAEMAMDPRYNT